ncbi:MAG: ATP-dependent chaperone ClpB [Rhodobacteraceae bacterium]|nr:ATP-dependent chaperone ClpB [Paracoccaceae bacterium]
MQQSKYTERLKELLARGSALAAAAEGQQVTPLHLLAAIVEEEVTLPASLITKAGGDIASVRDAVKTGIEKLPKVRGGNGSMYLNQDSVRVLSEAESLASANGDSFVSAELLLSALAKIRTDAGPILRKAGLSGDQLASAIGDLRKGRTADSATAEAGYDALKRYARDLTENARNGRIDPIIGRDEEIRRTMQVLSRRTKNNPILIGEPGVGKTAIAGGLALRLVKHDVAESLAGKRVLELDIGAVVAGTQYRGEFEERLNAVLTEINQADGDIILFIDEVHLLIGAGKAQGSMDASNLLKPALARGDLRCIGATTLDEYRKHIEKDAALARRFQPLFVTEPTVEDTESILRGIKEKYELHHGVRIKDSALVAAAALSNRYITDRFLPDKAIDLVDEAASRLRMEVDSKPEELDALDRDILQKQIEVEALKTESEAASRDRLEKLSDELAVLKDRSSELTAKWQSERDRMARVRDLKEQLEAYRTELDGAQRMGDLARAGELKFGLIPPLEKLLEKAEAASAPVMVEEAVSPEQVAAVVERWTGIPTTKLLQGERGKLLRMEQSIARRVVAQEAAVTAVACAVRRARAGLNDPDRPIGSFLFLGPTGVGKTELTKALAEFLFDDENAMVRIDMSEYMEKHSVARLIGAPPGYVGYDDGGTLTEAVRRRPYQVVLLDEVEKAHPDVFNLLLQLLDDGVLTDGQGRTADFKQTLVVMTSNLGSEQLSVLGDTGTSAEKQVLQAARDHFRPEFLNRLDEIIVFDRLTREDMVGIVDIQLDRLRERLAEREIALTVGPAAKQWLADAGYDPVYGARPLKRVLQKTVQDRLAEALLGEEIAAGQTVELDAAGSAGLLINGIGATGEAQQPVTIH